MRIIHIIGNFDYLNPREEMARITLLFPDDMNPPRPKISMTWDVNDDPFMGDDVPPSEYIDIFRQRNESYLFTTQRRAAEEVLRWMDENSRELDCRWARSRIFALEMELANTMSRIEKLKGYLR